MMKATRSSAIALDLSPRATPQGPLSASSAAGDAIRDGDAIRGAAVCGRWPDHRLAAPARPARGEWCNEDGDPGGRPRHAHLGREPSAAEDDDRDRRPADPVA